jgi:aminoglycoside 3-N-acetyltransferase I
VSIRRLVAGDRAFARRLFLMMANVFEEDAEDLSDAYLDSLLARDAFWVLAAMSGDDIVGGLTAHTLPMTRNESSELFIYDLAVRATHQRRGIGRQLVTALLAAAAERGIDEVFVPADTADVHALDFYRALGGAAAPVTIFTFS